MKNVFTLTHIHDNRTKFLENKPAMKSHT